jgi:hypothetical protein
LVRPPAQSTAANRWCWAEATAAGAVLAIPVLRRPVAAVIEGRYDALDGLGLGDADIAAVIELLRR